MKSRAYLIVGTLALATLVALLIAAWGTLLIIAPVLLWGGLVIFVLVGLASLAFKAVMAHLSVVERRQELRHADEKHELERELALTLLQADKQGNYPIYLPRHPLQIAPVMFAPGNSIKGHRGVRVEEEKPQESPLLVSPQLRQPSQRSLLAELEPNMLQVCPGIKSDTGESVILSIEDAVHFKLIGSSGFGKSCLAAALIEQAITLNVPDLLQIALLDLEHKTSRLFEDSPNVATLQVGRRSVPLVATNADEVALYLGYLKIELDRRARLSETDLQVEPILLVYIEELLSLQYEVDEKLLAQMLKDLSTLAVRIRKYRMFLLACAQTDYSTPELKTAQKQFRSRMAFAVDTTAARAAGFMSTDLIKQNFVNSQKGDGQFVLETPGVASLMLAPVYDVKQKLLARERSSPLHSRFNGVSSRFQDVPRKTDEDTSQANFQDRVSELRERGWGKIAIIEKVWGVKAGGTAAYKNACAEYERIIADLIVESEG